MKVGVERAVHEADMNLILYDVKLLFEPFWSYIRKIFRYLCFAKSYYAFVLKVSAKWNLDETFVRSDIQYQIVVIELSL
jgi:hypothetical protein